MSTKKREKGLKVEGKDKGSKTPPYLSIPPTGDGVLFKKSYTKTITKIVKAQEKKAKKPKPEKIDGLSPDDLKRIHKAVRQVWSWSHPWRLVKKRCLGADGFPRCERPTCPYKGGPVPKTFVDHVINVGKVGGPQYIQKMFVPSTQLQGLCKKCHDKKTKREREQAEGLF